MLDLLPPPDTLWRAFESRDAAFDGLFWTGVRTTGIFCRPTCPARKPRPEHVDYFPSIEQAMRAGYRPCKRCRPLAAAGAASDIVTRLVAAVEAAPARPWRAADIAGLGIDASTARRYFKRRFGMSFTAYARAVRLGAGLKSIREGAPVIAAQLDAGFDSASGFRDAFARTLGVPPLQGRSTTALAARWLDTPLGPMLAIADETALLLLEFIDRRGLERELELLRLSLNAAILPGETAPLAAIADELGAWFAGRQADFRTPLRLAGTPFQNQVWSALRRIPPGTTTSYSALAERVGRPGAARAVATANGANRLAIIVPCHRVLRGSGDLAGYAGGVWRKRWLIAHEARSFGAGDPELPFEEGCHPAV